VTEYLLKVKYFSLLCLEISLNFTLSIQSVTEFPKFWHLTDMKCNNSLILPFDPECI